MAKASWCTVAPASGNGNKTIVISATAHTGRTARSTTVAVQNQNGAKPSKTITVNQAAKALSMLKVSGPTPASIPATGAVLVVTGKSNAKSVVLSEDGDRMSAQEFKVNGVTQTDVRTDPTLPLFRIAGDPGAGTEYSFESKVTIPDNPYAKSRTIGITYVGYNNDNEEGNSESFDIQVTQAGAASSLSTNNSSVSLSAAGTAQNIILSSNDDWVIS